MRRTVRLTESDLTRLVRRIVKENYENSLYSDIMGLITNSNSSHEETIDVLNSIVDEMSSSRKLRRDVEKRFRDDMNEGYEDDYTASGYDSIGDAAHSSLKSKGHSHTGKDDSDEFYIVFDGDKFYEGDFEIADYNDTGDIPRVEDGKLIIANPAWGS